MQATLPANHPPHFDIPQKPMRHISTTLLKAGLPDATPGQPIMHGPTFASLFHAPGNPLDAPFAYGRFSNPTWVAYEAALTALEGASSLVFGSGMAAIAAVFGAVLKPGDVLIMPADCYYTSRLIADGWWADHGVTIVKVPTAGDAVFDAIKAHAGKLKLVWLETPANPSLDVCDIAAISRAAHAVGALVGVDNTTATAYLQQPIMLGADIVAAADTKALTGHSDLILGHVSAQDPAVLDAIKIWRTRMGAIAGPFEVWLAHRSLATLSVRFDRQCESAMTIAQALAADARVSGVRYPGLPNDPSHAIAAKQMSAYGCVISFDLRSSEKAQAFLTALNIVIESTSFGGVHSSAERRARWGGDAVSEGFVRMSIGCEFVDDLIVDIHQALAKAEL
jgi:cystathionine gamma-lyase